MASEATAWQLADLDFYPGESSKKGTAILRLDKDGEAEFREGSANPNAVALRPDGTKADVAAVVDEPAVPPAEVGQQVMGVEKPEAMQSVRAITPGGQLEVSAGITTGRVGGAAERVAPPQGGSFAVVEAYSYSSDSLTKLKVNSGGKDYPVDAGQGVTAVALPTDGKDAQLGVEYDGLTQWFSLTSGERQGSAAAGFYDGLSESSSTKCQHIEPEERVKGFNRTFDCSINASRDAYLAQPSEPGTRKTEGWPKDGHVFLTLSIGTTYQARWYPDPDSWRTDSYESTVTLKDLTVRAANKSYSAKEVHETRTGWGSPSTVAIFEVPAGVDEMTIGGSAAVEDTREGAGGDGGPQSGSATFKMNAPLQFLRSS